MIKSYISFSLFESNVNGQRDNMLYILKTCTDDNVQGLGLSKMLHWVLVKISVEMNIDYISAYVTSNIERHILESLGGFQLLYSDKNLVAIIDEIMETHHMTSNHILVIGEENYDKWKNLEENIINCNRPKNK